LVEGRDFLPVVTELSVGGDFTFTNRVLKGLGLEEEPDTGWYNRI
jgi:hypothetical protein